jgi:hypothetical protein
MLKTHDKLLSWDCPNSPGEPVCIIGENEGGYSVNLYVHAGEIIGVSVFERSMEPEIEQAHVGLTPRDDGDVIVRTPRFTT